MNMFLMAAAGLSVFLCLIHTFLGGRSVAVPLLEATDLHPVPKYLSYYCWHIATIVMAAIAIMFTVAGLNRESMDLAWAATAMTAAFCALGLAVPPMKGQKYKDMPQGWLFLPIVLLGVLGGAA